MKNNSLALVFIAQLMLLSGCDTGNKSASTSNTSDQVAADGAPAVQLCEVDCQKQPNMEYIKLPLNSSESNSLLHALPSGQKLPASTHLDASVVNGNIAFSPDSEPAHITNPTTTTLSVAAHGAVPAMQIKVVATPEAAALLHKRIGK